MYKMKNYLFSDVLNYKYSMFGYSHRGHACITWCCYKPQGI